MNRKKGRVIKHEAPTCEDKDDQRIIHKLQLWKKAFKKKKKHQNQNQGFHQEQWVFAYSEAEKHERDKKQAL